MRNQTLSVVKFGGLLVVLAGLIAMAGCGGGSSSSAATNTTPAVSLSPMSLTFTSGVGVASAAQAVTVTNSGSGSLTFSSITVGTNYTQTNTCGTSLAASASCMISVVFTPTAAGAANGTLTITDNAAGSPQTVTLSGTGTSVSVTPSSLNFSSSAAQTVTVSNSSSAALAVMSVSVSGTFTIQTNTCGLSVAASGSCTISVTPTGSAPWSGMLTIVDAVGTQTVSLAGTGTASNTVPVTVSFGPNGYVGPPTTSRSSYYNGVFTSVTVCQPGTATCVMVPNVLVDTGSVGLRVLQTALTGVTLTQINDGQGDYLNECTTYGDGSFNWGPVSLATVQIGGETASQVPSGTANSGIAIQLISSDTVPVAVQQAGQCATSANTPDEYTVATLGANGILGVGTEPEDCDVSGVNYCDNSADVEQYGTNYWVCSTAGDCAQDAIPDPDQLWNPVAAFSSSDTNGVQLSLPSILPAGQATVSGTLTFGIGTQSDNAIGTATTYALDDYGNFNSATLNGVTYTSQTSYGSFIDSGTNTLAVSDPTTLNTTDCDVGGIGPQYDIGYYCPNSPLPLNLTLTGTNSTSTTVMLTIDNAVNLFSANPTFAAFDDLGGPSCIPTTTTSCTAPTSGSDAGISPDYFDLGLPFFFGRPIFVGIAGTNYPNGYWAF